MSGINKAILVGHLGKDPEIRALESGTKVASFPLATSETYRNKEGQRIEQTEWHNIVAWRGLAEISEKYLKKGNMVYIEGRIKTRNYEKDGVKKYITEIVADNLVMLGSKRETAANDKEEPPQANPGAEPANTVEDDLPF